VRLPSGPPHLVDSWVPVETFLGLIGEEQGYSGHCIRLAEPGEKTNGVPAGVIVGMNISPALGDTQGPFIFIKQFFRKILITSP